MNNHTVRIETSFGNLTWMLPTLHSDTLRQHPEEKQQQFLAEYTKVIERVMHFIYGCMSLPPKLQEKYLTALNVVVRQLATEGLEEVKQMKEGK